jgi:ribose 5-phosphate isomerase B
VKKKNIKKTIVIASDHAGYDLKSSIKKFLLKKKTKVIDLGTNNSDSVDYPYYAHLLSKKIKKDQTIGILVCGSGTGMSITANRHKNVRAALCYNLKSTKLSRQHNNANVITIGARLTKKNVALKCINMFIKTKFIGGRHLQRISKI